MNINNKQLLLLYDLYWLRYEKPGDQWYELTDFVRDHLNKELDGKISFDNKACDVIVKMDSGTFSIKSLLIDKSNYAYPFSKKVLFCFSYIKYLMFYSWVKKKDA